MNPNPESARAPGAGETVEPKARAISAHDHFRGPVHIFGKPVARDIIFSNYRGIYKKKVEKRQRWLLVKIPFVNSFLEKDELITLITSAYAPLTKLERYLLRYLTVFQRRALLVFTDRRMLYIPTTFTYEYSHCLAEIRYANCKSIHVIGRSLSFIFHDGEFEQFRYIGRKECRKLRALAGSLATGAKPNGSQKMTYLCTRCGSVIPNNSAACPQCRLRFRTAALAARMALLIPGGGYFYMHNTLYGVAGAILEVLLAVLLFLAAVDLYRGFNGSVPAVVLLSLALAGIKAVAVCHSQDLVKGCFPVMKQLN